MEEGKGYVLELSCSRIQPLGAHVSYLLAKVTNKQNIICLQASETRAKAFISEYDASRWTAIEFHNACNILQPLSPHYLLKALHYQSFLLESSLIGCSTTSFVIALWVVRPLRFDSAINQGWVYGWLLAINW